MKIQFLAAFLLLCLLVYQSCSLFRLGAFNGPSPNQNPADPTAGIYVSTNGNDTNSGITPDSPVLSIQTAISNAVVHGYTNIYIQEGIYTPGNGLNASGSGVTVSNTPLAVWGGFDSVFSNRSGATVLDGGGTLFHLIFVLNASGVLLDGLVLRNGYASGSGDDANGGGIYISNIAGILISGVKITNNRAADSGGGLYIVSASSIRLKSMTASSNSSFYGGAIYIASSSNCIISNISVITNSATNGGGCYFDLDSDIEIQDSFLMKNWARFDGGAAYINGNTNIKIINTSSSFNNGQAKGGAFLLTACKNPIIGSCVLTNNASANSILFIDSLENLVLSNNIFGGNGPSSVMAIYEGSVMNVTGQTIVSNIFLASTLISLYYDNMIGQIYSAADLNDTNYTGAAVAYGNTVQ